MRRERREGAAIEGKGRGNGEGGDRSQMVENKQGGFRLSKIRVLEAMAPGDGGERNMAVEEAARRVEDVGGGRD